MAKVTSKYQVSIPRRLADQLNIAPGDDIEWRVAGEELRISRVARSPLSLEEKLKIFDAATRRQVARNRQTRPRPASAGRGWTREELYDRGRSR
jgi:AbrB family looped-hinge helix DNA binding protein